MTTPSDASVSNHVVDVPKARIPVGVWPVMLTPFHDEGGIDWRGVDALVDWYIESGVAGLFTVCLSSEMYQLSPTERLQLAARVVARAAGRTPVVAAGAFGDTLTQQAEMAKRLAGTGVTAVVLTVNQLAMAGESDAIWQQNAMTLCDACDGIALGLYECPQPYHRTLTPEQIRWAAKSGRFQFLKDTCCKRDLIDAKLAAIQDTPLRWFNAHGPTLLHSLRSGGHGYSGIAANFYPELFVRLCAEYARHPQEAEHLQRFLTLADQTIRTRYPASAKQYLGMLGLPIRSTCRQTIASPPQTDDEVLALANLREAVADVRADADLIRTSSVAPTVSRRTPSRGALAEDFVEVYQSPDPQRAFAYSPGILRLDGGRLVATFDLGGPGAADLPGVKWNHGESGYAWQGKIYTSDDGGRTWVHRADFPFMHARPFVAGKALYVLGHAGDLMILRSDDAGSTWSAPTRLSEGQTWHQAPCNVHHANGCVYLAMERRTRFDIRCWYPGEIAPVLLRGPCDADLTRRESWTFASELPFYEAVGAAGTDLTGLPFYATDSRQGSMVAPKRHCAPPGWLETNVVQFTDPDHLWCDPSGRTFHLWMRAHTGGTGYACMAKVVEQGEQPGTGPMTTLLEKAPSGKTMLYVPCPGGQMKFHVLYDENSKLFWLLSTQAVDSMIRLDRMPDDRYNLPNNERRRLQLHFSKNMIDWCFAGLVAVGPVEKASRHYASMAIDGDDLVVLSRSGDVRAKSPHDGNLITFHRVAKFRELVY